MDRSGADRPRETAPATGAIGGSLDAVYLAEWDRLVRLAALLLGDGAAGEDAVQDAFVTLNARGGGGWDADFASAYIRKAVVNACRSALRRRALALRHRPPAPEPVGGADAAALHAFERSAVVAALRRLPRRQREALVLRYYEDLSLASIAETMGVSVGTVKSTLSKAST
ncbi:MAG: sigma-70 family RNA polymerase sigma factor, partial [Actinomycetota bacterium]|nr:sigma-70 family RNA polymerase sigma factor [Actinomycetota bacterium]